MDKKFYCLLNDQEISETIARKMLMRRFRQMRPSWNSVDDLTKRHRREMVRTGLITIDFKNVNAMIVRDLELWLRETKFYVKSYYRPLVNWLTENLPTRIGNRADLIDILRKDLDRGFVARVGKKFSPQTTMITQNNVPKDGIIIIRNILNNEKIIRERMELNQPFWFLDSGYTNFLSKRKHWHRLVFNNIHHAPQPAKGHWPSNRLSTLPCHPRPWTQHGSTILVVESSDHYYQMWGDNRLAWRRRIEEQIRTFTDRPIEWKSKSRDKKSRTSVYDLLSQNPKKYYCVISEASAAAVESIWCGIPVITLKTHVSNAVARDSIRYINDLYRGDINDWLCALTYSQWTYDEIVSGNAIKMIKKYHA